MQPAVAASDPTVPTTDVAAAGATARRRWPGGWLVGPVLALVFLGYPIRAAFEVDPTPARVLLTLGGAALFGGGFVWLLTTRGPSLSAPAGTAELLRRRAAARPRGAGPARRRRGAAALRPRPARSARPQPLADHAQERARRQAAAG